MEKQFSKKSSNPLINFRAPENVDIVLLVLLCLLGFWIRKWAQDSKPIHIDDLFQIFAASRPTLHECIRSLRQIGPHTPFLDYIIDFSFLKIVGNIDTLRLLPIFWGTCAIIITYLLGRFMRDGFFGLIWAALLTFSIFHIDYSQRLRHYSLIVFLSVLCIFFFFKFQKDQRWFWPYVVSTAFFHMAYVFSVCMLALQFAYTWVSEKPKLKWVGLCVFISITALGLSLLGTRADTLLTEEVLLFSLEDAFGKDIVLRFLQDLNYGASITSAILIILAIIGLEKNLQSRLNTKESFFFVALILGTLAATFLIFIKFRYFFNSRHGISIFPFYMYFVASGIHFLWRKFHESPTVYQKAFLIVIIPSLLVGLPGSHFQKELFGREPLLRALESKVNFLRKEVKAGDRIVFSNPNSGATILYYLDREALFQLDSIKIIRSYCVFLFPKNYLITINSKKVHAFTTTRLHPSATTIDTKELRRQAKECVKSGNKIWLYYSDLNFSEDSSFNNLLDISMNQMEEKMPDLYTLKLENF